MTHERMLIIKSLARDMTLELVDGLQHFKDVFRVADTFEIIDRDLLERQLFKLIDNHLADKSARSSK